MGRSTLDAAATHSNDFLRAAYRVLDFESGVQFLDQENTSNPTKASWVEQARKLNADAIFFVQDNPTALFFKLDQDITENDQAVEEKVYSLYLKIWNTSRIPLFFIALPTELRVYSAFKTPVKKDEWLGSASDRWLARVQETTMIAEKFDEFSRSKLESGYLFQKRQRDFDQDSRVDYWLLKNLRLLRQKLEGENREKREHAHALIGRSIFVRYLEDRQVLVGDYFSNLSDEGKHYQSYVDVLSSKQDTYKFFYKLREDFNGDLFPLSEEEERVVETNDLKLLKDFLSGDSLDSQQRLLFWAYDFKFIPTELISNIYEEFYHEHGNGKSEGTHYTPASLVDFVLSQTLTSGRLEAKARVLDPACGSGIFLVETFKRMVFYQKEKTQEKLSRSELERLLTKQIAGIDINKSAIQVAAFSLYLAYLDFLDPPDIRKNKELPKLIYKSDGANSGQTLFHANAFQFTQAEKDEIAGDLFEGVSELLTLPQSLSTFDVVVGNPP